MYNLLKWCLRILFSWPIYIDTVRHDHKVTGGKILAANHPSTLDPIMLLIALDEQISILMTQSVFNIPIIGSILVSAGQIPVIEGQGKEAYRRALKILKSGGNILIFPEGALSEDDGSTNRPFSGAIRLSLESKTSIIPVGVSFSKDKLYRKQLLIKDKIEHARFYLFGRYNITVGKPIFLSGKISDASTINNYKALLMKQINRYSEESAMRLFSR